MEAKLYLSHIGQEKIRTGIFSEHRIDAFGLCCDALCCVLDFSKDNPLDEKGNPPNEVEKFKQRPALSLMFKRSEIDWIVRKEDFGGLLWNVKTGHIFQLDEEAFTVLYALSKGRTLPKISAKYNISESSIYSLLSEVNKNYETA